jgi:hypothetical protein
VEGLIGFLESARRVDHAVLVVTPLGIAGGIDWQERRREELGGLFEHGVHQLGVHFAEARQFRQCGAVVQFVHDEAHVA